MELIRYLHNIKEHHYGCVMTIGNFDGVHIGHQAVIRQLNQHAKKLGLPTVVMIFEPQPLEYFFPERAPTRLSSFREKLVWLSEHDIDRVVCLRFRKGLSNLRAEEFVEQILVKQIGARSVIIGDDFRFGKGRAGNFTLLQDMGDVHGFDVVATESLIADGARVSSSQIRELLTEGSVDEAERLLGRPYSMIGRVIHGDKRGRQLGFPTANIAIKRNKSPIHGVFAVQIQGLEDKIHNGVANIGTRPVFDGKQMLLEVHVFDFDEDIYGKHLQINFLKKIRSEEKFDSIEQLTDQINRDTENAREFFQNKGSSE